ncbi:MAG: hypothetical protein KME09_06225 [Pleurocapsa minor HA4230-MV1]|jgi:hypothetical protein|nr:hypothetical protein [Pleurocapsa minor HA4230-MV1]
MEKSEQNRFTTIETDKSINFIFPPPGFNNPITTIFMVVDILLLLNLSAIIYGIYYAELVYKIGLTFFSMPWIGLGTIVNFVLVIQFVTETSINISDEEINISSSFKRKQKTFKIKEIIDIKIIESNKEINNIYPKLFIITKNKEYDLNNLTGFIFTNQEIVWLANKISKYIKGDR